MDILFDIGNVLLAFDFEPALKKLTGPHAQPDAQQQILKKKDLFEAGKLNTSDYVAWASEVLDFHGTPEEFESAWVSIFTLISPMWDLAESLHSQGHRLILFSNTNSIHAPYCLSNYPVFRFFEGAVMSHEIGEIKPFDDFYLRAIEKYNLIPQQTIYIDDLKENIQAGLKHGFKALLYDKDTHQEFLKQFKNSLENIKLNSPNSSQ